MYIRNVIHLQVREEAAVRATEPALYEYVSISFKHFFQRISKLNKNVNPTFITSIMPLSISSSVSKVASLTNHCSPI